MMIPYKSCFPCNENVPHLFVKPCAKFQHFSIKFEGIYKRLLELFPMPELEFAKRKKHACNRSDTNNQSKKKM